MKTIKDIQQIVATYYGLEISNLTEKSNKPEKVKARQVSIYCCYNYGYRNKTEVIANHYSKINGASMFYTSMKSVQDRLVTDPIFFYEVTKIWERIREDPPQKKSILLNKLNSLQEGTSDFVVSKLIKDLIEYLED